MTTRITRKELIDRGFTESSGRNVLTKLLSNETPLGNWKEIPEKKRDHTLSIEVYITDLNEIFSVHLMVSPGNIEFKLKDNPTIGDLDSLIKSLEL